MAVPGPAHFLLIGDPRDQYGVQLLRETLAELGSVQISTEDGLAAYLAERLYDVVIVDAAAVDRAAATVSYIREQSPYTKVIVITASPHWRVARDVFRAGAADYLRKSRQRDEILGSFRSILE